MSELYIILFLWLTVFLFDLLLSSDALSLTNDGKRREILLSIPPVVLSATLIPPVANALTPQQAELEYNSYAPNYDTLDGGKVADLLGIKKARRDLLALAHGNVLEIGVGTGLNLELYSPSQVHSLTVVDISQGMLEQAQHKAKRLGNLQQIPTRFVQADATLELVERFGKESFDTVVDSFSLCVMGTQGALSCLNQMSQVLVPSTGRLLLLENSKSDNAFLARYQDLTAETAATAGGKGCVYNQNVRELVLQAHLTIVNEQPFASGLFRAFQCAKRK